MVYLTRIERFNAAHKLWRREWSEEKNKKIFGKCANKNWHGHNYTLHVTVKSLLDSETGYVIDAKDLKKIIIELVIDEIDHKNLNLDVPFIPSDMNPTVENLVMVIWKRLEGNIPGCTLHSLKLYETENIYVQYFGE